MADKESTAAYVTDYMEKKAPAIHDAFSVDSKFSDTAERYEVKTKRQEFVEAIEEYRKIEGPKLGFDPTKCSWAQVVEQLEKAHETADAHEGHDKTRRGKTARFLNNVSRVLRPALDALPDELSLLKGGLAIIFYLAQRQSDGRQRILDVFSRIPEIIATAHTNFQNFPNDNKLQEYIENL
ncbi:hypothetical protein BX600DRAFT_515436 [Xylariales sp. PMI_506]|nr:hypothetical protein BX600DRAFT_515436 [Xylariales sp. PMI_506]